MPAPRDLEDDDEAADLFSKTVSHDPFPAIPPALLNSSDIYNYVHATGMVCPFRARYLKSASYAIRIGSKIIYWDDEDKLVEKTLGRGQVFRIPENSIVFIKTKEKFRLPDYVAMRFNLKINNVHRGILLGTGPLVDPGFEGHLLIPLHNLTTNEYYFREGDTFVWVEFTKVSPHPRWDVTATARQTYYGLENRFEPFPCSKKDLNEWDYLNEVGRSIRSSISVAVRSAAKNAEAAATDARVAEKTARNWSLGSFFASVIALAALLSGGYYWAADQVRAMDADITAARLDAGELRAGVKAQLNQLREQTGSLSSQLQQQLRDSAQAADIERRLVHVEDELQQLENDQARAKRVR